MSGEGVMAYAGRWHHPGTAVVYCSESRALAALEQLVHLHRNRLPPHFVCFGVEISEDVAVREVRFEDLPAEWRQLPGPPALRDIGTRWAESGETVVLRVPSAVVLGEHHFLVNPRHPDFRRLSIGEAEPFELRIGTPRGRFQVREGLKCQFPFGDAPTRRLPELGARRSHASPRGGAA